MPNENKHKLGSSSSSSPSSLNTSSSSHGQGISSLGQLVQTTLSEKVDSPSKGTNFFAFGDGDGSWINILKQLYVRGVVRYSGTGENFDDEIKMMENYENTLKRSLISSKTGITYQSQSIPFSLPDVLNSNFKYVEKLKAFFHKLSCQSVNGKRIEVVFIGDLLHDRQTNNYGMIMLLAYLNDTLDIKILHSNHDYQAITLFVELKRLVANFVEMTQQNDATVDVVERARKHIFTPLWSLLNNSIRRLSSGQITGVYFGFSSISWFYTMLYLVENQKSIAPLENFLEMLDISYYPKIELVHARRLGQSENQKLSVFSHAPLLLQSPSCRHIDNKQNLLNMLSYFQGNNFFLRDQLQTKNPADQQATVDQLKGKIKTLVNYSLDNLFADLVAFLGHNYNIKYAQMIPQEKNLELVTYINRQKEAMRNFAIYTNQDSKSEIVKAVTQVVSNIQGLTDICKREGLFEGLLTSTQFLRYTETRCLFKAPYSEYVYSIHGHIGYNPIKHYNPMDASAVNLDSNGSETNPQVKGSGQFWVLEATTVSKSVEVRSPLPTLRGGSIVIKQTPQVEGRDPVTKSFLLANQMHGQASTSSGASSALQGSSMYNVNQGHGNSGSTDDASNNDSAAKRQRIN